LEFEVIQNGLEDNTSQRLESFERRGLRGLEKFMRKYSERQRIITRSEKMFTKLVDQVSKKKEYEEVDEFSENNR
jgi:hypothetical protein